MADLHITRAHALGMDQARKTATAWAEQAKKEFGMDCTYEEGDAGDLLRFKRSGVDGTLQVTGEAFTLQARLGFLLGAFKDRIEAEIVRMLDGMLAPAATGSGVAACKPGGKP